MAKYTSTDIINAAQWLPDESETMREFLAPLKAKIGQCTLSAKIAPANLVNENALVMGTPSISVKYNSATVTAAPTDYIVQVSASKLEAMPAATFERLYQAAPELPEDEKPATSAEKSQLNELVTAASAAATTANVSEDGSEYQETETWTTKIDVDALKVAVFNAHVTSHNPDATVAEVNDAIAVLTEAVNAFNASLKSGTATEPVTPPTTDPEEPVAPDKTVLTGAIAAATAAKVGATVSVDGSDVEPEDTWVSDEDVKALEDAIASAQAIVDDKDADQTAIDSAVSELNDAVQLFKDAAKAGTKKEIVPGDKSELEAKITEAEGLTKNVTLSTDGKDIEPEDKWTTQESLDALNEAIVEAKKTVDDEEAEQDAVDNALSALNAVIVVFKSSFKNGLKQADKSQLNKRIADATDFANGVNVSVDGSDIDPDDTWTTAEDVEELTKAIALAQVVADKADAKQDEVDEASVALQEAISALGATLKAGTKVYPEEPDPEEPTPANKTALTTQITAAKTIIEDAVVSEDGSDVEPTEQWVTQEDVDTLQSAVDTAQEVADNEDATQEDVDGAVEALNTAIATFGEAKQDGTKVEEPRDITAELTALISDATKAKTYVNISEDGTDVQMGQKWVTATARQALTNVITETQAVLDDETSTEEDLVEAFNTLKEALDTFNEGIQYGTQPPGYGETEEEID